MRVPQKGFCLSVMGHMEPTPVISVAPTTREGISVFKCNFSEFERNHDLTVSLADVGIGKGLAEEVV